MTGQDISGKKTSPPASSRKRDCSSARVDVAFPRLSNELIARIIDYLHEDIRSLKNCSLTTHVFLSCSRHAIFQHVHLNLRNGYKFSNLLESSPGIAPYVKEVHVTVSPRESPPWIDHYLPAISAKLPNVHTLHLGGRALYKSAPLLGFQSIKNLHIIACEFESTNAFLTLLASLPDLEKAYTHEMCVYRDLVADDGPPMSRTPSNFKSLTFNSSRGDPEKSANWLISRSFNTTIEYFAVCPLQEVGLRPMGKFVKACGGVLRHFKLGLVAMKTQGGFGDIFKSEEFTLAKNTNLNVLELCSPAALAKLYGADDLSFDWFPLIIAQISSPYIEEIGFYLWEEDLDELSSSIWDEVAGLLATPQFSSIKRIAFHVWGHEWLTRQIITTVNRKFARLQDRGLLHFDSTVDPACV